MNPKISVIILNYHRPADTLECIASVLNSDAKGFILEIIVVDNSEDSDSFQQIKEQCPRLILIKNETNLGYAEGNNVGIRAALKGGADYVFILNNDCVLESDALAKLLNAAERSPDTGILSPLVCRYHERAVIDACGTSMDWFRLRPREVLCRDRNDPRLPSVLEAEIIPGAALMIRKEVLAKLGLFDPSYFLIHEDADLCLRSRNLGYKNRILTDAYAFHKVSGTFNSYPLLRTYYSIRNFLFLAGSQPLGARHLFVYAGLVLLSLKRLMVLSWTANGRSQLYAYFLGIADYFMKKRGKCAHPELNPSSVVKT